MPRGFREHEKEQIRAQLREQVRAGLATHGYRKLSVEALSQGAGISKGAFYLFYESKEALVFEVLAQFEEHYQRRLLEAAGSAIGAPRERVRTLLEHALVAWRREPIFRFFDSDEYRLLLRALPPELVDAGMRSDVRFAEQLIALWRAQEIDVAWEPALLANLLRAIFLIVLHEPEFDPAVYPAMVEELLAMIAVRLTGSEEHR
jgi:AcrR family transcriptional regulator